MESHASGTPIEVAPGGGYQGRIPWNDRDVTMGLIKRQL